MKKSIFEVNSINFFPSSLLSISNMHTPIRAIIIIYFFLKNIFFPLSFTKLNTFLRNRFFNYFKSTPLMNKPLSIWEVEGGGEE